MNFWIISTAFFLGSAVTALIRSVKLDVELYEAKEELKRSKEELKKAEKEAFRLAHVAYKIGGSKDVFEQSIEEARDAGVEESKILHNKEEIDRLFTK